MLKRIALSALVAWLSAGEFPVAGDEAPSPLRVGRAGHAFDHLGAIGEQASAAVASGATIIYTAGFGSLGYEGLPPQADFEAQQARVAAYNRTAKEQGVELAIGYLCATSIVRLEAFDQHWSSELRAELKTPPAEWLQVDRQGNPLPSWYGGDYRPACMNHPDWRAYQRRLVRQTLEAGHDGMFFDNPTVHQQGCYCTHCMEKFAASIEPTDGAAALPSAGEPDRVAAIRALADARPREFLRFRATTARDFLADMRHAARQVNPAALITCNNSLNAPEQFFAQCRSYAYNINELSKVEDFVLVEDMATQPRTESSGRVYEYGPTYELLRAISHGKPIVACTLAGADYHTPARLVRLAMAEAAAHGASYLLWPTWPEEHRGRMAAAIRPQAELLAAHERLLNDAPARADAVLFLPYRNWLDGESCAAASIAASLTQANVQYRVICEDDFTIVRDEARPPVLVVESRSVFTRQEAEQVEQFERAGGTVVTADTADWLATLQQAIPRPAVVLHGPPSLRAVVHDAPSHTVLHLYNLNVERLSSFEDRVTSATDVEVAVRVPLRRAANVVLHTADKGAASGPLPFTASAEGDDTLVKFTIPRIEVGAIVVIAP